MYVRRFSVVVLFQKHTQKNRGKPLFKTTKQNLNGEEEKNVLVRFSCDVFSAASVWKNVGTTAPCSTRETDVM